MLSEFMVNYTRVELHNDIKDFIVKLCSNQSIGSYKKKYNNLIWFLANSLDILSQYDIDYYEMNILEDDEYQNIINSIKQILNRFYYGFTE